MSVFEDYVMIGHAKSTDIWIYDANALAKGQNSPLIAKFTADDFDSDYVTVVRQHGASAHVAVVVGADFGDDDLNVFGLLNPTPGKASKLATFARVGWPMCLIASAAAVRTRWSSSLASSDSVG